MQAQNNYNKKDLEIISKEIMNSLDINTLADMIKAKLNIDEDLISAARKYRPRIVKKMFNNYMLEKIYDIKKASEMGYSGGNYYLVDLNNPTEVNRRIYYDYNSTSSKFDIPAKSRKLFQFDLWEFYANPDYNEIILDLIPLSTSRWYLHNEEYVNRPFYNGELLITTEVHDGDDRWQNTVQERKIYIFVYNPTDETKTFDASDFYTVNYVLTKDTPVSRYYIGGNLV